VNRAEIKARLVVLQDQLLQHLDAAEYELLPDLMTERAPLIEEIVAMTDSDTRVNDWIAEYLARDQEILSRVVSSRNAIAVQIGDAQINHRAHLAYIQSGFAE
jgi:hypothetical protein